MVEVYKILYNFASYVDFSVLRFKIMAEFVYIQVITRQNMENYKGLGRILLHSTCILIQTHSCPPAPSRYTLSHGCKAATAVSRTPLEGSHLPLQV